MAASENPAAPVPRASAETEPVSPRGLPVANARPLNRVRRAMSQAMRQSVQQAALSQIARETDLTLVQQQRRAQGEGRLSLNAYLLMAVARCLRRFPLMNAELVGNHILEYGVVNLGLAVAVEDGLVVPVIHGADRLSLPELAAAASDRAERARAGRLTLADIEGGTFTLSNLGMYDVDVGFALPRPPEAAVLLAGRVQPRPVAVDGSVALRELAWFSLTFDHRFVDGATAASFLREIQAWLLAPEL